MDYLDRLKDEMSYQKINQIELSEKTGISINTIRGWFSKRVYPDLISAYKIARILRQPLEFFLDNEIFEPSNFHLPTSEARLLENYRKMSDSERKAMDSAFELMANSKREEVKS